MTGASSSSLPEISLKNGIFWLTIICLASLVQGSPYRSKNKVRDSAQLVYDQKQTGDYNIQLHLKDFQIIALLGDDTPEYEDYSYDYADFTVKPSTTSKPSTTTTTLAPSSTTVSTTIKIPSKPANNSQPDSTTASISTKKPESNILNIAETNSTELTTIISTETTPKTPLRLSPITYSAQEPQLDSLIPGKIKVQIVDGPSLLPMSEPALGIVPGEDVNPEIGDAILQGEISNYRRCGSGYARDKKGRCRRVRKPSNVGGSQLPFGLGNFASSLATRLRLALPGPVAKTAENDAN